MDISGQRFGRLVAIKISHRDRDSTFWLCKCDCGKEYTAKIGNLRACRVKSCGCYNRDVHSEMLTVHGMCKGGNMPAWLRCWDAMIDRCYRPGASGYKRYGGRGIGVCDRWRGPEGPKNFIADMGDRPSPLHSIDRKDNNGNYEPGNCRWATKLEQAQNRRSSVMLTFDGRTQCMSEWSRELGMNRMGIQGRLDSGWSIERALSTPCAAKSAPRKVT